MIITEQVKRMKSLMKLDEQSFPSNSLMTSIIQLIKKGGIDVNTLGKKVSSDLQIVQKALQSINPGALPRYGADGLWGKETINALRQFNSTVGKAGNVDLSPDTLNLILRSLESGKLNQSSPIYQSTTVPLNNPKTEKIKIGFIDLNTDMGYNQYAEICQRFIDKNNPNPLGITGIMLADSARKVFINKGSYVPPEIALGQLVQEGGLRPKNIRSIPIVTRNPFNVGNWDSEKTTYRGSVESGIDAYYNAIADKYLPYGSDPHRLLYDFSNIHGKQYAADPNYEKNIRWFAKQVKKISDEVLSSSSPTGPYKNA